MTRASDLARLLGAGATINDGTTITTADNTPQLKLISTDADANAGPVLELKRDSSSPAADDFLGNVDFIGENNANEEVVYGEIFGRIEDVTDGAEDGRLTLKTMRAGNSRSAIDCRIDAIIVNDDGDDVDFRVESDANTHGIYLDAGAGLVGIGNSNPDGHYSLADDLVIGNGSGGRGLTIYSGNDSSGYIGFNDAEQNSMTAYIQYGHNDNTMTLASSAGPSLKIDSIGAVTKTLQPAFNVQMSTNSAQSGSGITPSFGTEHFDQNGDFSGTTFTAPVTGKYYLSTIVYGYYLDNGASYYYLALTTSNRQYVKYLYTSAFDENMVYYGWGIDVLADMDANDTATVFLGQVNGHSITQLLASNTYFTGGLFC